MSESGRNSEWRGLVKGEGVGGVYGSKEWRYMKV